MLTRRDFIKTTTSAAAAAPLLEIRSAEVWIQNSVERAFRLITEGKDVLDALIAGVNIPELDASCMHGPKKRAGAVASIQGVRTPSLVAKAVMDYTDHHLLVGDEQFARAMGFEIEDDLNTENSRKLWREWKRRIDPEHRLDPDGDARKPIPRHQKDPGLEAGLSMVRDGLIREGSFWGTINCDGMSPNGDICGVTTTSGLAWKIPGRTGDAPILGAVGSRITGRRWLVTFARPYSRAAQRGLFRYGAESPSWSSSIH